MSPLKKMFYHRDIEFTQNTNSLKIIFIFINARYSQYLSGERGLFSGESYMQSYIILYPAMTRPSQYYNLFTQLAVR